MDELSVFSILKEEVLKKYRQDFPYALRDWKTFSSQDIQNLISRVEEETSQRISEKWIYTHLKPAENSRLPRKDMLDILAAYTGWESWDEFCAKNKLVTDISGLEIPAPHVSNGRKRMFFILLASCLLIAAGMITIFSYRQQHTSDQQKTILLKDTYTNKNIDPSELKIYQEDEQKNRKQLEIKEKTVKIHAPERKGHIIIESPFYETKKIDISGLSEQNKEEIINLKPDDYAMILKAFIQSDIKDWQTRKMQLNKILAEDFEAILVLKGGIGFEYFNKQEFSQKLIIPTETTRRMKIIELKNTLNNQIQFIRLIQE